MKRLLLIAFFFEIGFAHALGLENIHTLLGTARFTADFVFLCAQTE